MALARPARWRITLSDDTTSAYPIELPVHRQYLAGFVLAATFAGFAGAWWSAVSQLLNAHAMRSIFDLAATVFLGGWVLGWSVGTFLLGVATVAVLFMGRSLRVSHDYLVSVFSIGPLKMVAEYARAAIYNLRIESAGEHTQKFNLKFSYGVGDVLVGGSMTRGEAEQVMARLLRFMRPGHAAPPPVEAETAPPADLPRVERPVLQPLPLTAPSSLALIVANLLPLLGVVSGHITLAQVMVLFWSESAIIGFFTLVKIVIVGKWAALPAAPFFTAHFGGFMAVHFIFVYGMFVHGLDGPAQPPALAALAALYRPLWPAAAALCASHAVSFALNFIGRGEYRGETVSALMAAPYQRIAVMHVAIIFGGWIAMTLDSTAPAVALLIGLKLFADLRAHTREHGAAAPAPAD